MGAHQAVASGNEAIFINPAALALNRRYAAQIDYAYGGPPSAAWSGHGLMASIVDSVSNPSLPTGIAYRHLWLGKGKKRVQGSVVDLGMGFSLHENFAMGGTLTYYGYRRGEEENYTHQISADLSAMLVFENFSLALAGYNLLGFDTPEGPRAYGAGMAYGNDRAFRLALDYRIDHYSDQLVHIIAAGGEYLLDEVMPVRLGYTWDTSLKQGFISGGLGFVSQNFGADVGARWDPSSGEFLVAVGIKLHQ